MLQLDPNSGVVDPDLDLENYLEALKSWIIKGIK
jgi:hypothetical protein